MTKEVFIFTLFVFKTVVFLKAAIERKLKYRTVNRSHDQRISVVKYYIPTIHSLNEYIFIFCDDLNDL